MKMVPNKDFMFPVGARVWSVYKYFGDKNACPWQTYSINARIIKGWDTCGVVHDTERYCPKGIQKTRGNGCRAGGMKAVFAQRESQCVCGDDYDKWVDEAQLRALAEAGQLKNQRIRNDSFTDRRSWRRRPLRTPKVWTDIKDKLKK